MSSETLHEDAATLGTDIIDQHRAFTSLIEELEAVDWYNQRAKATVDPELRTILEHNRDEEKEHASMVLEWLRRHDPTLSEHLTEYLFTKNPLSEKIAEEKAAAAAGEQVLEGGEARSHGSLAIGDLRKRAAPAGGKR
jgi:uncharacterized protein